MTANSICNSVSPKPAVSTKGESHLSIATIPGDGTGPEVTAEALKVLDAVAKIDGISFHVDTAYWLVDLR